MTFLEKVYCFLLIAASGLTFSACSDDKDSSGKNNLGNHEGYRISLTLSVVGNGVRAGDETMVTEADESYLGDLTLGLCYDGTYLMDLTDILTLKDDICDGIVGPMDLKRAFASINRNFYGDTVEEDKFQLMVTANWKSYDPACNTSFRGKLNNLWNNSDDYNFQVITGADDTSPVPDASEEKGIPMFGLSAKAPFVERELIVSVPMLRALAKFEIFDVTKIPDSGNDFTIKGVILKDGAVSGRLIPDISENPDWNLAQIQVSSPSLPSDLSVNDKIRLTKSMETLTYREVEDEYNKWICYVPEMDLNLEEYEKACFHLELEETHMTCPIPLKETINKMTGNEDGFVLRNHHYRIFVTRIKEIEADFMAEIDPDPFDDMNFIYYAGNKWWVHKEEDGEIDVEVWYKFIPGEGGNAGRWEKEWRFYNNAWQIWDGTKWEDSGLIDGPFTSE